MMGKLLRNIVVLSLVGIFLYSGARLASYVYDGYVSNQLNERMKQAYTLAREADGNEDSPAASILSDEPDMAKYMRRFDSLLEINEDLVGWIEIAGTTVSYPVVQHSDNDYYLNHNVERQSSARGSIFMDYRNNSVEQDVHTVIYGHHMKDGSMFGALSHYKDEAFYQQHTTITFDALELPSEWEIFSVYIYSPEDRFFAYEFSDDEQYEAYLNEIVAKSIYDTGIKVSAEDQLLTLVTCTYEVSDARFIIHAKRIS